MLKNASFIIVAQEQLGCISTRAGSTCNNLCICLQCAWLRFRGEERQVSQGRTRDEFENNSENTETLLEC